MSDRKSDARALYLTEEEAMGLLDLCLAGSVPFDTSKDRAIAKLSELIRRFIIDDEIAKQARRKLDERVDDLDNDKLKPGEQSMTQLQGHVQDTSLWRPASKIIDAIEDCADARSEHDRQEGGDRDSSASEFTSPKSRFRRTWPDSDGSSVPIVRRRRRY